MEIVNIIIKILSLLCVALGVIMIYDARKLSKKWFSFGDRNDSTKILKIVGFVISIISGIIMIIIS